MNQNGTVKIEIPVDLYEKLKSKTKEKGIDSVSNYLVQIINQALSDSVPETNPFDKNEEAEIKKRLESLGYM